MTTEKLLEVKADLIARKNAMITEEDKIEIAEKVKAFEKELFDAKAAHYDSLREGVDAKIAFIDELLSLDVNKSPCEIPVVNVPEVESEIEVEPVAIEEEVKDEIPLPDVQVEELCQGSVQEICDKTAEPVQEEQEERKALVL